MNETAAKNDHQYPFTGEQWDALRSCLKGSLMAKTNLCSLAKNLGLKWPIRGKEEIPERYLASTLEALSEMTEFYGKGNRLSLLYTILLETKKLDDPFADMVQHFDELPKEGAAAQSPLDQLEIPPEFPVELMPFSGKTRALCKEGGHETLIELISFLKHSPSAVIINDEFRQFTNCLNDLDQPRLRQFLPIREGSKGIFLAEAIGHIGRRMNDLQAATLVYAYSITHTKPEWAEEAVLAKAHARELIEEVKVTLQTCFDLMPDEAQHLRCAIETGLSSSVRFFVSLNDPDLEGLAMAIAMAGMDIKPRFKGGFINNLLT